MSSNELYLSVVCFFIQMGVTLFTPFAVFGLLDWVSDTTLPFRYI
jgi:hypothetical protein